MGFEDLIVPLLTAAGSAAIAVGVVWAFYSRCYVPVPPNRALVLFGHRASAPRGPAGRLPATADTELRHPRIVVGGGVFVAPWNRGVANLSLEPVDVDLTVRSIYALEGRRASGWETRLRVQAKIPADPELLVTAAENLLGKSEEDVRTTIRHAVEGGVPAVLARLRPEQGEPDWERLAAEIQAAVAPDLVALGLVIRSLAVTELRRIAPMESAAPPTPALPARSESRAADASNFDLAQANLDFRLARVERNLGTLATEVLGSTREASSSMEESLATSVFDLPLGYDDEPRPTLSLESPMDPVHDSMGGEPSPRSPRPSLEGRRGSGERESRPLLDAESKR